MKYASTIILLMAASPVTSQVASPMKMTTDAADRAVMAEVAGIVSSEKPDIVRLNAVLAKLPRPTPLRGMVQTVRAGVLASAQDVGPAVAAVEEALRLLPDDPRPKMVAANIFTFSGSPQRAADLWMLASRESPDIARLMDRYVMMALVGRLTEIGDRSRADQVSARLGEIGFSAGLAPERSDAALASVREAMRTGRNEDALLGVTAIGDPEDLLTIYVDNRYKSLWPRIAEWAGPDLSAQTMRYLKELRGDWVAADNFITATPYARRLSTMHAKAAVVSIFLPMLEDLKPNENNEAAELLAPIVARSLAEVGRETEARTMLQNVKGKMSPDNVSNALNIDAAYLTLATAIANWPLVITEADGFLSKAKSLGTSVNRSASMQVQAWRACALLHTGQMAAAELATAEVALDERLAPGPAMNMFLCRGETAAARALLIRRLSDETTRSWALRFVQPHHIDSATPLDRLMEPQAQAVREAPDVVAAANQVGRILPTPLGTTLPEGFDPFRIPPTSKPLKSGEI